MEDIKKIQYHTEKLQLKIQAEIVLKLAVKRLSKDQKDVLYKTVRYSYLQHEELLETSKNPYFLGAKDYIMQGLSIKLSPYEKKELSDGKGQYSINLKPRPSYATAKPIEVIVKEEVVKIIEVNPE